jgi:hypothetical protein
MCHELGTKNKKSEKKNEYIILYIKKNNEKKIKK